MTSINSALSGQYYQLSGNSSQSSSSQTSGSGGLTGLLNAIGNSNTSSSTTATTSNAYALNLSDSAKAYLANLANQGSSSSTGSGGSSFLLSPKQRDALDAILAKYKDKPVTQENYDALQNDLDAAGLAPDQLALRDQLRNLNPTRIFLDALNGQDDGEQPKFGEMSDAQKTQGNNYMQSILKQWQATAPAAPEDDSTVA